MTAPGRSYREGISLPELFRMFPDDETAERWFEEQRWGQSGQPSCCPMCGSVDKQSVVPSRRPLPYYCGECRSAYSVKTGSIMHRSKIPMQKWIIAIYLWSVSVKSVSSMRLHRDLGITQKSAYFMAQRIREAWEMPIDNMSGPVEVDETFIGGKRKNMSNTKRKALKDTGRGGTGKAIVVGAKDRDSNQVQAKVIQSADQETLHGFIDDTVANGATVYTDEARAYQNLPNHEHEAVCHSVCEYVNGMAHTNGIESFWAMLKRAHKGTFHQMSAKHLQRYVNEFSTRHNMRHEDTIVMMQKTVAMMIGKRLMYKDLVG